MDKLWAPWRMKYILAEKKEGCIFCEGVVRGDDRGGLILHRGSSCFVMMNRFPYNNGHIMVAPYRHVGEFEDLNDAESLDLMKLLQLSVRTFKRVLNPQGFNVGINIGQVAGAGVIDHIHVHVVPRWDGDTNFMPVLSETKVINEELEETYDKLFKEFEP
ncbi:MAG: HIT domain-containing protein [Gemmatimonadota bacterium]|nr:MAG: HIT domain-containing protein [Gemmatimonadota bacterium]